MCKKCRFPAKFVRDARISECGKYRYRLDRVWDRSAGIRYIIMLNPADADAHYDDDTVCKCMHRAYRDKFGGIVIVNLFAWRDKVAKNLRKVLDPIGPENDNALYNALSEATESARVGSIIAAWSRLGSYRERDQLVRRLCNELELSLWCFGKVGDEKAPIHPGRISRSQELVRY